MAGFRPQPGTLWLPWRTRHQAPPLPQGPFLPAPHLVREWNGRTYQVEVIDNGYRFDGKTYPSLTTIAQRITGTHWSGPRFFGLTQDALPVSPDSAQQHPKPAVDIREPRPFHRTAEDGELLPKSDILESQLATSLEGRDERANKRRNHAGMVLADRRLIKFGARG